MADKLDVGDDAQYAAAFLALSGDALSTLADLALLLRTRRHAHLPLIVPEPTLGLLSDWMEQLIGMSPVVNRLATEAGGPERSEGTESRRRGGPNKEIGAAKPISIVDLAAQRDKRLGK